MLEDMCLEKLLVEKNLTKISPNKTISGSIGSFILSYIGFFVIYLYFSDLTLCEITN